ncbi:MAG TPA: TM0106 family RecB-like putative nuclease [Gemmatimonadales bacterium]|nr:TM0106 family RecB-like putative nuclease [Gemmatimonadales bacterium]
MFPLPDGTLRYSPRDLVAYLEGDFAAWCERMAAERARAGGAGPAEQTWVTPDEGDEEAALAVRKGNEHERRYLEHLRERYPTIVELDRTDPEGPARTLAAMEAGVPVIYQAHLTADGWGGYPDFLFRCTDGAGPCAWGGWHYTPWDTKLARSAKPGFLIQLCAYADLLEAIRGFRPGEVVFVLGQGEVRSYLTRHYFHYYRQLRRSFAAFQGAWDAARVPDPGLDRSWGRWERAAEWRLAASDHLSRVANITRGQVRRLEEAGIATLTALGGCEPARRVPKVSEQVLDRLRLQARLQLESRGHSQPLWCHRSLPVEEARRGLALLPPPSDGDVFFDMEGFPYAEGGLEYLFGAVTRDEDVIPVFHDWWAHDQRGERAAFEGFIDWLTERRRRYPSLHVYHYASYEESAVKRLMGKYATREAEVDDLLRGGVFVDLYNVVRQGFVIGTPSYSLKDVERLYMPPRTGPVISAGGSVVEYQKWIDSGEPGRWEASPILRGIREYNQVDCESTMALRSWLRERQCESGIAFAPDPLRTESPPEPGPDRAAAEALAARLVERGEARLASEPDEGRLDRLVGWLVEFHRREEKPMWWRKFDRHEMTVEERYDDRDCLAGLTRTERPGWTIKRSHGLEYRFDPAQETKLRVDDKCFVAGTALRAEIVGLEEDVGLVELKAGKPLPDRLCLIPDEFFGAEVIKKAIARYGEAWERGEVASQAVDDLLRRRAPRIKGHDGGPLVGETEDPVARVCDLAVQLDRSTLCIQGPPGTGKTYTAAAMMVELLLRGRRIGVTAQSHKVIMNAMRAAAKALERSGLTAGMYKVGDHDDDPLVAGGTVRAIDNDDVPGLLDAGACLVGGTAWLFSREELAGRFDCLFIDEAGQVSLANAVAVALSSRNLILVGDQMQLAQPTQGTHPEDTGLSCLEYLLHGQATVPDHLGVFLGRSRRMHPAVCRFVSEAVYDGRLGSIQETGRHRVIRGPDTALIPAETGIVWLPVEHDSCTQSSDEECEAIAAIVAELLGRRVVDREGRERPMTTDDILIVAPFNLQVRCLRERLDRRIRVGSVDKFQGQEAPVVIVSLCASTLEEAPRGASFLLSPNRLNVAVSRAEALAIVVGCPDLVDVRCRSVEEMRLVNLLCHLVQYAEERVLSHPA